ncbi:MAG: hypothetical protein ACYC9Q_09165 [Bacillota bacterium]
MEDMAVFQRYLDKLVPARDALESAELGIEAAYGAKQLEVYRLRDEQRREARTAYALACRAAVKEETELAQSQMLQAATDVYLTAIRKAFDEAERELSSARAERDTALARVRAQYEAVRKAAKEEAGPVFRPEGREEGREVA